MDDDESIDRSFQAGAIDFISKPIRWTVLKNRIKYILASRRSTLELELLSEKYEMILGAAANGICGLNNDGIISYVNPAGLEMLGYGEEEVMGKHYLDIFKLSEPGSDEFGLDCCPFFTNPEEKDSSHFDEIRMLHKDGTPFPADFTANPILRFSDIHGTVLVFRNITERLEAEERIRFLANHDTLTQLPNRNYFRRRLPQAVSLARRYKRRLCLLFIDLDRFKPINDTFGHAVGDLVLIQVAERLHSTLRSSDSVCRLGGDEFVILLESTETEEGAGYVAQKAIELLNEPIEVDKHVCYIGASIGISVFPDDCDDADTMLQHADIAMYDAKKKGRNCWCFYSKVQKMQEPGDI